MKGIPMPKKSRGQKRQAKTKKRQQRHARRSSPPFMPFLGGMPFDSAPDAPQGFRPLSMTQTMLEYAAPIMAYVEDGTVQDPNDALQVGLLLWNSTLPEAPVAVRQSRRAIVTQIETTLQMDREEAEAFFDHMIARKAHLFPDEMQPEGSMTMFMRKEVEYLITPFEESQLHLSDAIIPPDGDDDTFLNALEQLDARIDFGEDYNLTFRTLCHISEAILEEPSVEGGSGAIDRRVHVLYPLAVTLLSPSSQLPASWEAHFCSSKVSHTDSAGPPGERPMTIKPRASWDRRL